MKQMKFGFSDEMDEVLNERLERIQLECPRPWIAGFDADGTLWDTDLGESFFQYQIESCELPNMPEDPWKFYEELKLVDPLKAYLWLAQINKGQKFEDVREWARQALKQAPIPVFEPQRQLIQFLNSLDFEVYIVTASVEWAVRPAAHLVNVDPEHVIGIKTKIEDGIVTDVLDGQLTWRDGKAKGLLAATGGVQPVLAVGNTIGDQAMIESASHVRMAVRSRRAVGELAETEEKLFEVARRKGWFTFEF